MAKKSSPDHIQTIGFNISAVVSVDRVGHILKAMFDNGCPPSSFDLKAIFSGTEQANGAHVIEPDHAVALPAPPKPTRVAAPGATAAEVRSAVLAVLAAAHPEPMHRRALWTAVEARQQVTVTHATVDNIVMYFKKDGIVDRPDVGIVALTKKGLKLAQQSGFEPAPEPMKIDPGIKPGSHAAFVLETMRAEPLLPWSKLAMREHFKASGRAGGSAKDTVQKLFMRGLLKRINSGKYLLAN